MLELRWKDTVIEVHFLFIAVITFYFLLDESGIAAFGLIAALMHEMGHLAAFVISGYAPQSLSFEITGIRLERRTYDLSAGKEAFVLLAGSFVNLLTFAVITLGHRQSYGMNMFALTHLTLGVMNLLPVMAFDGGKLLELLLSKIVSLHAAETAVKLIQIVVIIGITSACILYFFLYSRNVSLLILSGYLWCSIIRGR